MLRRILTAGIVLAPLFLSACDDNDTTGPNGTPGTVSVRAYVDSDGSGTFNEGDIAIAGQPITLIVPDESAEQATTDAEGVATFTAVTPGSYTVQFSGVVPDGAVLATASRPVIVVPFLGGTVSGQFRYVFNPGSITGVLFRDNNSNTTFDAGDTPAPGTEVLLFAGTDTTGVVLNADTTDANGAFSFPVVRAGDYTLLFHAFPTITLVGGNAQPVTVVTQQTTDVPVRFTGSLLSTIAQVRATPTAPPTTVAFEGVATVAQNTFASPVGGGATSQQVYVQDATAGILVFGLPVAANIAIGDSVRVIGTRAVFSGEAQVTNPTVTKLGSVTPRAARAVSVAQVLAGQFMGELITVPNLLVRSVGTVSGTTGSYNVNVQGATAADTFQVRIPSSNTGIPASTWVVGQRYDVTGDLGVFNTLPNLKPRSLADVKVRSNAIPIAQARTHAAGDTVMVEGVVYVGTNVFNVASTYIMDATGGTNVFNVPAGVTLVPGDSIRVTGMVTFFSNEFEVARFSSTSPPIIEVLGTGTIPQPRTVTGTQLASRAYDGQLVRTAGLLVDSLGTVSGSTGSFNVFVTAPDGTHMIVRNDRNTTGITTANFTVGSRFDVTGAALNFGSSAPFTPQIKPRSPADIVPTPTNVITIAAAEALLDDDTATVEGVVTSGQGGITNGAIYIQDATGGIQIFNVPAGAGIVTGDVIRVNGILDTFNGEREIVRFNSTTPPVITVLGKGVLPAPRVITGTQLLSRAFEGELVRVNGLTVTAVGATDGSGRYNVTVTAPDAATFTVRLESPAGSIPSSSIFTVGNVYDVTGIAAGFGNTTTVEQLKPRTAADIVAR
jgi:hypothetical protein